MVIDLKAPAATKVLKRLVEWADVVITNFPHGTREKLHLGYDEVAGWNPRVVYADITGFGDAGPDAGQPGFDLTAYWARSGCWPPPGTRGPRRRPRSGAAATTCRRSGSTRRS